MSTGNSRQGRETSMASTRQFMGILCVVAALAATLAIQAGPASAATLYWDGGTTGILTNGDGISQGTAGTWNTTTLNWDQGADLAHVAWVNAGNDTAVFGGTGGTVALTTVTVGGLTFDVAGYTISGSTMTFGAAGSITTNADATISSIIAGSAAINKAGAGALTLSGVNTFTGALTLSNGTLKANTSTSALGTGAATLILNGGTLDFNHSAALNFGRNTTVGGTTTIISEKNVAGPGVNYTLGTLGIGAYTLNIGGGNVTSGTAGVIFGATTLNGSPTFNVTNPAVGGTTLTLGAITETGGAQGITKTGSGTLVLSGAGSYTGATNISAGTLTISNAATFTNTSGIVLSGTGSLNVNAQNASLAKLADGGGVPAGTFLRYSQTQGSGGTGPGTILGTVELNVSAVNPNYTLDFGSGSVLTSVNASNITYGSPITLSGDTTIDSSMPNNTLSDSSTISASTSGAKNLTLTGSNTGANTISGIISDGSGTVGVTKTGTGSWTLSGVNSFTGGLTIKSGRVNGTAGVNNFGANTGVITIGDRSGGSADATLSGGFNGTFANPISVAGTNTGVATITSTANTPTFSGAVTLNSHALYLSPVANNLTLSGGMTGSGNLVLNATGAGVVTLSTNSVDNTGTITNSGAGTATNVISAILGGNVSGIVQNSATSSLSLRGANNYGGTIGVQAGTLDFGNAAATYSGAVSGSGAITKSGGNTASFTGASPSFEGSLTALAGTLAISGGGSMSGATAITATGGTIQIGDSTVANNDTKSDRLNTAVPLTVGGTSLGGTVNLYNPSTGDISQSFTALNVALGASTIQNAGTGGTATMIFTSANPATVYNRSIGGVVNFGTGMLAQFTTLPTSVSAGTVGDGLDTILVGALYNNADFVKVAAATNVVAAGYDAQDDAVAWGTTGGHNGNILSAAITGTTGTGTISINALKNTGAGTVIIGGASTDKLSVSSGMILTTAALTIDGPGKLTSDNGKDLVIYNTGALTINAPVTGSIGMTKVGSGTLVLASGADNFTGDIGVGQGTLNFAPTGGTSTYSGNYTSSTGTTKSGAGTAAFTGPVSITGNVVASAGTMSFSGATTAITGSVTVNGGGTLQQSSSSFTSGGLTVGSAGTSPAVMTISGGTVSVAGTNVGGAANSGDGGSFSGHTLNITGGSFTTNALSQGSFNVAYNANNTATLNISGDDTIVTTAGTTNHFSVANGLNSRAYINFFGGTITAGYCDWGVGGVVNAYQSGGTFKPNSGRLVLGYGVAGGSGTSVYTMTGGTMTVGRLSVSGDFTGGGSVAAPGQDGIFSVLGGTLSVGGIYLGGANAGTVNAVTGKLNVAGTGLVNQGANTSLLGGKVGVTGVINLAGGTLATAGITSGPGASSIALAGGTLKYTSTNVNWLGSLGGATVFPGGVTIDTQAFSGTISQTLKGATGSGVASVTLVSGAGLGTGYLAQPTVSFTGGTLAAGGTPAEAVAKFDRDTGKLIAIVVVNPGQYDNTSGLAVVLTGGGATTAATANFTTGSNAGGGLTKIGTGTLTLSGTNTYTGTTLVNAGTLAITTNTSLDDASTVKIDASAKMNLNFTGTETIADLWIGDTQLGQGTYDKNHAIWGSYFTGTGFGSGVLQVKHLISLPDTDGNGVVNAADFITLKKNFGKSTSAGVSAGDFNGTGTVDWADLQILIGAMGAGGGAPATVPEPCSAMLLVFGAAAMLRRRRA